MPLREFVPADPDVEGTKCVVSCTDAESGETCYIGVERCMQEDSWATVMEALQAGFDVKRITLEEARSIKLYTPTREKLGKPHGRGKRVPR